MDKKGGQLSCNSEKCKVDEKKSQQRSPEYFQKFPKIIRGIPIFSEVYPKPFWRFSNNRRVCECFSEILRIFQRPRALIIALVIHLCIARFSQVYYYQELHDFFLVYFSINKHLYIFQRLQTVSYYTGNVLVLIYSKSLLNLHKLRWGRQLTMAKNGTGVTGYKIIFTNQRN